MTEHAVGLCAEFSTGRREGIKGEDPEERRKTSYRQWGDQGVKQGKLGTLALYIIILTFSESKTIPEAVGTAQST